MSDTPMDLTGPDLAQGIPLSQLEDGAMLACHLHGEAVLLARRGSEFFAVGATCTHYGAPLADGLQVGDTVRCPWHHACFSLRTGEALRAPALDPLARWRVERVGDTVFGREKFSPPAPAAASSGGQLPRSVVVVGGGAAGNAAAEMLRREGYAGRITMLSADRAVPCDRPNLSKGLLAGTAPAEFAILRPAEFYREHDIELRLDTRVAAIEGADRKLLLADGSRIPYDALLLATGAEPVRLDIPGAALPHVHYLRTLADCESLVARAAKARQAVVIGSSFIGLEVAASLRTRGIAVRVVAPEEVPMQRVLGPDVGRYIRRLHEQHGVTFHLGTTASAIDAEGVTLKSGERLTADLVVVGVGVRPTVALAEAAGLAVDKGIVVSEYLETSVPGIFAAGDIARWPDPHSGERIRVEHWVVAERQGQTAARNILGRREPFDAVPFFWTEQYDFTLNYVGHAESWDRAELVGRLDDTGRDCTVTYSRGGIMLAVATIFRDQASLAAEVELEQKKSAR